MGNFSFAGNSVGAETAAGDSGEGWLLGCTSGAVLQCGCLGAQHGGDAVASEGDCGAVLEHEKVWMCRKAFGSFPGQESQ